MMGVFIIDSTIELSIIIPVYNVEKHLEQCLESLIDETINGYEIILIDDGSTDGSPTICDSYRERYSCVKVIHRENVGSAAAARNTGLELATGRYVTFFDSDDHADRGYLRALLEHVQSSCDIYALSHYTDYSQTDHSVLSELTDAVGIGAADALRELEKKNAFNFVWNKIYKRALLEQEPKTVFYPDTEPGEDLIFNTLCFEKARTVTLIDEPYYHWVRRGEDTLANRFRRDLIQKNFLFIEYRERLYASLGMEETDAASLAKGNLSYVFSCVPNMYRAGKRFPRKERLKFYRDILGSEKIAFWFRVADARSPLLRQLRLLYRMRSPILMDLYYSAVMGLRNVFGNTWVRLRNKAK